MTLEVHTTELRAKDGISPVMKQVAANTKAATGEMEQAGQRAGRSWEDARRRATEFGAAMGTLVGGASALGQAYLAQERQVRGVQVAYGDASRELLKFADHIQDVTTYSDDAARASLLTASTITREYGIATDQIDDLVQRAADLATVFGYDLDNATNRVTAAIRGEAEAAEALGIAMSDSALQAYAASQGMTGWNTTMTEAERAQVRFQVLMEQTAYAQGEAAKAADTHAGRALQLRNEIGDLAQTFGGALGPLGEYTAALGNLALAAPLAGAALGKLAAGLGSVGLGGGALAALALLAGAGVAGYDLTANSQNAGGSTTENLLAGGLAWSAGAIKKITPGSVGDALFDDVMEQYRSIIRSNDFETAVKSVLLMPGESDPDILYSRLATLLGIAPGSMTQSQFQSYVKNQAAAQGQTVGGYVLNTAATNSNFVQDPLTGRFIPRHVYQTYQNERYFAGGGQTGSGAFTMAYGNLMTPFDPYYGRGAFAPPGIDYGLRFPSEQAGSLPPPGGAGIVANSGLANYNAPVVLSPEMQKAADRTAIINAIGEENMAYFGLVEGINSADDALKAFHATQANVLEQESVYSAQISEFSSQVNAQDAAYEILNKRREEGIALTDQETQFLNNYAEANERGTGAVEDATVAQGMLAQQYLLNMKQGDELNRTLAGNTDATSSLVAVIYDLILAMDGIPPEVRSRIEIERAQESLGELAGIASWLNSLNGFTANAYVNVTRTGISLGSPDGVGISLNGLQLGGLIPGAAHGRVMGGGYTLVGEAGPELIAGGQGGMVIPASATRARLRGGMGGDTFQFNAPIMVYANNPQQFAAQMREQYVGGARQ